MKKKRVFMTFLKQQRFFFLKKDFIKVDDIAERVGLSKGMIYLYFKNKEELFLSIIPKKAKVLQSRLQKAIDCKEEFADCLERYIQTYLEFFAENEAFFKIMHSEKARMDTEDHHQLHQYAMEITLSMSELTKSLLVKGGKQGQLRDIDLSDANKALRGIMDTFIFEKICCPEDRDLKDETSAIMDLYLKGIQR